MPDRAPAPLRAGAKGSGSALPEPGAGDHEPSRSTHQPPEPPPGPDTAYSEAEEAEVRKRLEDLGYVE